LHPLQIKFKGLLCGRPNLLAIAQRHFGMNR
jgi:hypothetical protein